MDIIKKKINKKSVYFYTKNSFILMQNILDLNFAIIEEYKNDKRTHVARISIENKEYILKKIYFKNKIKQFFSIFKKGEALSTLINVNSAIDKGIKELAEPLGAIVERKNGMITNEILIMKYYNGRRINSDEELLRSLQILDKIYFLNRFHGDCNPANIYIINNEIIFLDTKLKRMILGDYRKHYDVLTLLKYFKEKPKYPYKKNIFYYLAYIVRYIRDKKRRSR